MANLIDKIGGVRSIAPKENVLKDIYSSSSIRTPEEVKKSDTQQRSTCSKAEANRNQKNYKQEQNNT